MRDCWKTEKMCEVFELQMGKTPSRDNPDYWNGSETWVSIGDMNSSKTISSSKEQITNKAVRESGIKIVPKGCVIMSFKLSVGKVAIAATPLYTNEAIMSFKPKDGYNLLPDFIYYYLRGYKWDGVNRAAMGLTLNKATISQGRFSYPPIPEQERIVAELDLLSGIINKQKQLLKELDTLAQSIFYDMFGNPDENPKGWDVRQMGELFEIGSSKRVFESEWTEEGVPFYRAREIVRLSKNEPIESPIFISEELYADYSKKYGVPTEGDIMITAVGTLGVSYIVKKTDRFYFKDGNILWFKNKGLCETRFIKDEYATDYVKQQIQGNANAAVVGTYTIMNANKTKVIVPPLALQKDYVERVKAIDNQKDTINRSIVESQKLFDYTMDKYFG